MGMTALIHSSDGNVDDFVTSLVLEAAAARHGYSFKAVVITNGDCEPKSAVQVHRKFETYLESQTETLLSASRVLNPFPWEWRWQMRPVLNLPSLRPIQINTAPVRGDDRLKELMVGEKTVIVATGPLTTIADLFKKVPSATNAVKEIHWMGGAVDIPGNLRVTPEYPQEVLNDEAEWNVFADPEAVQWIFDNTAIPIHLYPLDISDTTLLDEFLQILERQEHNPVSKLISELYHSVRHDSNLRMWDVVAAVGLLRPDVFEAPEKCRVKVDYEGRMERNETGREVLFYRTFKGGNPQIFYETVAALVAEPPAPYPSPPPQE